MKAFVTGSTGLLGSNLVELLLAQGFEVKALARSTQKAQQILGKDTRAKIIIGEMEDINGFAAELADCDVLFHTAAYFREYFAAGAHWSKLKEINVDATIALLTEAERRGIKQTVYVSSSVVIGGTPDGKPGDESTPPDHVMEENLYMKSKVLAERAIADWLKTHKMPVVLVLPTAILGPQDAAPTAIGQVIINLLERKLPMIPPGGMEFVDARDVAQAMINAVECGKSGERYIISRGYYTMKDFAQTVEAVSGVPAPRLNVPYAVMLSFVWLMERIAILRGKPVELSVTGLRTLRRRREVTARKAVQELGITLHSIEDTLRDEVAWYKTHGYVNKA